MTNVEDALYAARTLDTWGSARGWRGPDPYDALSARALQKRHAARPFALRILTQFVKRSPVNIRPLLGITSDVNAATLAHVISAYARNGFLDADEAREKLDHYVSQLERCRTPTFREPSWGYPFDVQTRVFFYPRTTPNTIVTAFAGLGLLDAYELAGHGEALDLATGAGEFFVRHVPQTETDFGAFFGYLPGDSTPIHNANMLVCALLARLYRILGRAEFRAAALAGVDYTLSRQRPDGSWPYGELAHLRWVDGFHTGYVLDALLTCAESGISTADTTASWRRGLQFYVDNLIEEGGAPRYEPDRRYPIDGQCLAQAIQTLSRAAPLEPELAAARWRVLSYALRRCRRVDGAFIFQHRRFWTNRIAYPRWVQTPMLSALAHMVTSDAVN